MRKFAVFSGFLGSGKTTTMIAITKYYTEHHGKAAMISNDLGKGVTLADHRQALLSGAKAREITDECICFCHDVLTGELDAAYQDGCELVISDIPGFGVGALEHVYHGLNENYGGAYEFAPFTVLIEPKNVEVLRKSFNRQSAAEKTMESAAEKAVESASEKVAEKTAENIDADMGYILDAQLMEADLILLNKCDLLSEDQAREHGEWLREHYPQADVLPISALTGMGLEELSQKLKTGKASMQHPDIKYEDEGLQRAMGSLSEYYIQYHALVCCNDFEGTAYLKDMAAKVQDDIKKGGYEIPHLKLLAWAPEGDYGKVDLIGADRPLEVVHAFQKPCTELAVILNASAACPFQMLDQIITKAAEEISERYQLDLLIFKKECMSMGAEE